MDCSGFSLPILRHYKLIRELAPKSRNNRLRWMKHQLTATPKKGPRLIIWLLTPKCNLACSHCYTARFLGKGELEPNQALNIVKSAAEVGVRHIGFTGGEVFLRQDALALMGLASESGMSTSVVTNGSMLDEEVVEKLAKYEVFTILSIDGASTEKAC